jgi:hypothetical protein
MTTGMPSLLDSIFGKQRLEEISLEEIYSVIAEFPSFNAAHFLLSKKLKQENDPAYEEETVKTALYFTNAVWLQSLLDEDPDQAHFQSTTGHQPLTINEEYTSEEEVSINEEFAELQQPDPIVHQEFAGDSQPVITINEEYAQEEAAVPTVNEEFAEGGQSLIAANEENVPEETAGFAVDLEFTEDGRQSLIAANEEYAQEETAGPAVSQQYEKGPSEVFQEYWEADQAGTPAGDQSVPPVSQPASEISRTDIAGDAVLPDADQTETAIDHTPFSINLTPTPPFDAKKAESIVFEPYHMIDYFASQGIRLVLEDQPADSFGKQLKSFTDWLKVMKRVPAQTLVEKTDERDAERIRHFAANSIEERDILTETMAEVLAKQGMYENAIALYQKLSLIYPPKSAYFASRIEQLKVSLS